MIELLSDIKTILKARKVRRMVIKFHEKRLKSAIDAGIFNVFEVISVTSSTRKYIAMEEEFYENVKKSKINKWKSKFKRAKKEN